MKPFIPQKIAVPGECWFHPAVAQLSPGVRLMTAQQIKGSDFYAAPVFFLSGDDGKNWNAPQVIPPFLPQDLGNGVQSGIADIRPFPLGGGECIVFGCTIYFSDSGNISWSQQTKEITLPPKKAVYAIRRKDGSWSPRGELVPPLETSDCRTACTQIVPLSGTEMLIPIYFEAGHCTCGKRISSRFACATLRARRQGDRLECVELGNILEHDVKRGFCEPSLIRLADRSFALTLRAEDGRGYCSVSADGLHWGKPRPWRWEDGTLLEMSSTQQHWFTLGEKVYLVYTRRDADNEKIFRYRAPLYLAEAKPQSAELCRHTEQQVFPRCIRNGEEVLYGNFHAAALSPETAVITDAALAPAAKTTELWLAEIRK